MKKIIYLLFAICYLLFAIPVKAQGLSLGVYPPILQINATPPSNIKAPITIQNLSDQTINLKIELRPFKPSDRENGQVVYISKNEAEFADTSIFEKVKIKDSETPIDKLTLSPKQKKDLALQIFLPKDEPPADYYFSVVFLTIPSSSNTNSSQTSLGISENVLLSIGPKGKAKGEIAEFNSPLFLEKGPVPFTVRVKNTNSYFLAPTADIVIKNIFGQTVGRVDLKKQNILANSVRNIGDSWNEKFPLGIYKAVLTLALTDSGPVFRRDIFFLAFPLNYFLYLLIGLLILVYLIIKVRAKI